jgi:hypothetical protein
VSVTVSGAAFDLDRLAVGPLGIIAGVRRYDGVSGGRLIDSRTDSGTRQVALSTPGLGPERNVDGVDGMSGPVAVTGTAPAVPFLGRVGTILDLPRALAGSVGTVAAARSVVVARTDTPGVVLARLHRDGGGDPTTYAAEARRLELTPQARADELALWVAVGVALVALTHLVGWLTGQVGGRRAEVAGLRAAGVGPRAVRRGYLVEALLLGAVVLVAAGVAAAATTRTLLAPMRLVGGWSDAPSVDLGLRPVTMLVVVAGAALVTAAACALAFTRFGRRARPSALRAADR